MKEYLIRQLKTKGALKSRPIIQAFESIDRADFIRKDFEKETYGDYPLSIGFNATISQPSTVAFMLELLSAKSGDKILDIGSGSGWTTALLAKITGDRGFVYGTDIIPELVVLGKNNLAKYKLKNAEIYLTGKELGLSKYAPYDKILVSAAASDLPNKLLDQLKTGGRLVIPINNSIWQIDKRSRTDYKKQEFFGFVFVPLILRSERE